MLLLAAFPYFAVTTVVRRVNGLHAAATTWLATGIAAGAYGIGTHVAFRAGYDLGIQVNPHTLDATATGTFHEANLFGSAMLVIGLTGIGLLALGTRPRRLYWLAALTGLLGVQVSLTRTAWIAFMAGLLLLGAVVVVRHWRLSQPAPIGAALHPLGTLAVATLVGTALLWVGNDANDPVTVPTVGTVVGSTSATTASSSTPAPSAAPAPTLDPIVAGTPGSGAVPIPTPVVPDVGRRVSSIADVDDPSIRVRMAVIRRALRDWREHPVAGTGVGSFGQQYVTTSQTRAWISNMPVRVLHDSGIVGLTLFGAALLALAWRSVPLALRPRGGDTEALALALTVAIGSMFIAFLATEGLQLAWYWLSFGLFAAATRLAGDQMARP
jgi:hypothetical protein